MSMRETEKAPHAGGGCPGFPDGGGDRPQKGMGEKEEERRRKKKRRE